MFQPDTIAFFVGLFCGAVAGGVLSYAVYFFTFFEKLDALAEANEAVEIARNETIEAAARNAGQ